RRGVSTGPKAPEDWRSPKPGGFGVSPLLFPFGSPQPFCKRLKELPCDSTIPFDQREELPEGEPVAKQVRGSNHRGRARAAVNEGDLTEMIARPQFAYLSAFAGDGRFPGFDKEEGRGSGTLHDDGLALGEGAYLEQAGNLLSLSSVHISEELHALD